MNLNDEEEEESFFTQHCLELAKLLRTDQTEHFLHLYDSLPSEWNGSRLDSAKEYIRQLQELDEHEFQQIYQRTFPNEQNPSVIGMSKQSTIIRNDDQDSEPIISANSRITSSSILQRKQHIERTTANNLACDEQHDVPSKHSSSFKRNNDDLNTKTRQLQPITNNTTHDMISNTRRTRTPVDSFVQLNLKPAIDITVEDYKKTRVSLPTTKNSSTNTRSSPSQTIDINDSNTTTPSNPLKKHSISMENQSHEEASFDYFFQNNIDDEQQSRSSSSSPTTIKTSKTKNDLSNNQTLSSSSHKHSKLITTNDFDSHGSSIATKSSSENSGSARTGSDSDDEHHRQAKKPNSLTISKASLLSKTNLFNNDDTPTMVLNTTSDNRPNQHDRISSLPNQDSYELVQLNSTTEPGLGASQLPRFKLSATDDDPNSNTNSGNDLLSYTTQRSQQSNSSSASSHPNRNSERNEQYHSNPSRKSTTRPSKKRKQLQQQEIIRTELIPGHRGDLDVDELVMFIDGNAASKQPQRQNSASLRLTDTNKLRSTSSLSDPNSNHGTTRRKSRKPIKLLQDSINTNPNENPTLGTDEDRQSIGFIDEDDDTTQHSINSTTTQSLPNAHESHSSTLDIESPNDSNTTNGEISLPEWLEPTRSTSPANDDNDYFSLSSTTLNNSNSEITSEPFVTVTHRRRLTKERRQDANASSLQTSRLPASSFNTNDKRRFQPPSSTQNGTIRSIARNGLSNIKPFVATTVKEENNSQPPQTASQTPVVAPPPPLISNNLTEQLSPRLSSHSSSSSVSSLLKRQSKPPPPVVFLNKSVDVELNDVSFGFDVDHPTLLNKPLTQTLSSSPPLSNEKEPETLSSTQSNDLSMHSKSSSSSSSRRSYQQQRNNRGPSFYSGSDIRPHHSQQNRTYAAQPPVTQSPLIDPRFLQYNQQQLAANYSYQLAYMNLLRAQYIPSQSPYVLIPTTYTTTTNDTDQDEKTLDDETTHPSDRIQEPLLVYTTIPTQLPPPPIYLHPTKKSSNDLEQQMPIPTMYPPPYYYPTPASHPAYFQPISSPSLLIDTKSQQEDSDNEDKEDDNDYDKSTRLFHQIRQQSSSHIMSNALQLVYSQERRNAQTDRFNLDQLTAYLATKWTDTIDHYEQGDDEILVIDEQ